jgi:hypothetical protein
VGRETLLDDVMAVYDVRSRHTIRVGASPATVYRAAREADLGRPALVQAMLGLRVAPAWLGSAVRGFRWSVETSSGRRSVGAVNFTLIAEVPDNEFVLGIMGRFWTLSGGVIPASPERFRELPPAGLAQAVWNFRVEPSGNGTELSTETRVRCADPATRRQFMRYWRLIRLGSGLMRRSMLRHIRNSAERDT